MMIKPQPPTPGKEGERKNPPHPRSFRRAEEITQILDVYVVRKRDTLLRIVPSFKDQEKRKEVKGTMFIQLKKVAKQYKSSDEEYVLISSLTRTITHGSDIWLVINGASKHMIGNKDSLSNLTRKDSPHKVKLGDDYQYMIKVVGEASYKLDSGKPL
jgi:hypothetical protein